MSDPKYKMPAWSYSSLTAFETCAKRYYHIKVAKDVSDTPGEAATWGQTVHKYLEDRVKDATPLPAAVAHYETLVAPLLRGQGEVFAEQQLAVNANLQPTDWFGADTWCRGIIDVGVVSPTGKSAVLLDWKTGKRKPENDQLKLFAGMAFAHSPELQKIKTGFVWLKENKIDRAEFTRDDIPAIWLTFSPRVKRMERAFESGEFPPKPSGLCSKWCPVPKSKCSFSGKS